MSDAAGNPNPYIYLLVWGLVAFVASIAGSYLGSEWQLQNTKDEIRFKARHEAYTAFQEAMKQPPLAGLLALGRRANEVATDSQIQNLEDRMSALVSNNGVEKFYRIVNAECGSLRVTASGAVRDGCEDVLKVLAHRVNGVDWSKYSEKVQDYKERWVRTTEKGRAYGWQKKVSNNDRLAILISSRLLKALGARMNRELHDRSS
mgnify:CR=1 FL=1